MASCWLARFSLAIQKSSRHLSLSVRELAPPVGRDISRFPPPSWEYCGFKGAHGNTLPPGLPSVFSDSVAENFHADVQRSCGRRGREETAGIVDPRTGRAPRVCLPWGGPGIKAQLAIKRRVIGALAPGAVLEAGPSGGWHRFGRRPGRVHYWGRSFGH